MNKPRRALLWIPTLLAVGLGVLFLFAYTPDIPLNDLKKKYANAASQYVEIQGMPVHYRSEGTGPTLILLHGTGSSLHTWDAWLDILRHDFRVVRLDLPGFGLTGPAPDRDYRIDRYVEFLREFTTRLGVDRFHLAGNSMGGHIAWSYALEYPTDVDRLVLIDTAGYPQPAADDDVALIFRLARLPMVNWLLAMVNSRDLTERSLREVYANPDRVTTALVDRYYELALRPGNRRAFVDRALEADDMPAADHRQISQPTLILWGAEDRWIPLNHGHGFAADIVNARLRVFPGVGHLPMEELPGPSARAVLTFLRDEAVPDRP